MSNQYPFTKESLHEMSLDELKSLAKEYDIAIRNLRKTELARSIYNKTIGAGITSCILLQGQW
jgi:hypothetical protein